ncbi:helix-turn-helix transcriptional regulator [uncultured Rubinisphaera sp.]|uniref:helix-turn-helix domain-containing protein n=1 Tax=uncultured Rubinisphaera sp. TaxID=1678686 RepID=UPI0030DD096B
MSKENTAIREVIASRLRMARESAGLSQGQVAKRLKMHRPTISEIEAGRRRVSGEEIVAFGEAYGVDANWITEGSGDTSEGTDKIMLAARQLSKLNDKDLDRLLGLLQMLRGSEVSNEPE